jgi:hypothetical protein
MIRDSPSFADAVVDAVNTLPAGEQATACTMPGIFFWHLLFSQNSMACVQSQKLHRRPCV